ncbi:hypothetical protein Vadar_003834 [Vaccinium darrowii]|uniref:Uncharacterized protein n=1 Tax=Vaccinium darrowii TaxID=229202 RepID=A0ACB7XND9_9ERIC|nr:hypothetical protein Vadar_003834 [Vaccinium darrowii]
MPIPIVVYVGGQLLQHTDGGPSYMGGTSLHLSVERGMTLDQLKFLISNAAGMASTQMTITYRFPSIRYPNPTYEYVGIELADNSTVQLIFHVYGEIPGYIPILFTEAINDQHQHRGSHREPGQTSRQQCNDNETAFSPIQAFQFQSSNIFSEQNPLHYTEDIIENEIEEHGEGIEEESDTSSLEDVDAGLDGERFEVDGLESQTFEDLMVEGTTTQMHRPPCPLYTQDTWSNIVDPSPPMPTRTQLGWDGTSDFFVGQVFSSKDELQLAMKKYCMLKNHVAKTDKSSPKILVYKCNNPTPCLWRLRACRKDNLDMWQITKYTGPHTCMAVNVTQDHSNLDAKYMAHELNEIVSKAPSTKIRALQEIVKKFTGGYMPSYAKTWAAKQIVIQRIHGDWDQSFVSLPSFLQVLQQYNPGTQKCLVTKESGIPGTATFHSLFWAFAPAIEGFKHCRPVLCVDGTFLTGKYKGTLLIAVSQDPENQIFPIAFAIVEKEDKKNWGWFLTCIKHFVTDRQGLCLISDRHPGLLAYLRDDDAYDWRPPFAHHRFCLRQLGANYHRRFGKIVGKEVKITAMESQKRKFKDKLSRLQRFANGIVHAELEGLDRKNWTFAYDGGRQYGTETTNVSENFNGVLKEARHLPIMATVMTTFYKCVEYFNNRVVKSMQWKANGNEFSLYAKKKYDRWNENALGHTVIVFDRAAGLYEVHTPMNPTSPYKGNHKHIVQLPLRRCTCNKFQLWKIPCSHVIAVCSKMSIDPRQFFSKYWSVDTTISMYGSLTFKPLPDVPYWPPNDGVRVLPPTERLRGRGRPKVN